MTAIDPSLESAYREAFDLFDRDKDGKITREELKTVMESLRLQPSEEQIQEMISKVDTDGNGTIEFNEFAAMLEARRRSGGEDGSGPPRDDDRSITVVGNAEDSREDVERAFKVFDIDGDGLIDSVELKQTMDRLGESVSEDDVRAMMLAADSNKDGRIDFEEFYELVSRRQDLK